MTRTAQQNTQLHALIGKLGIDKDTKREMVYTASKGRTQTSAELSIEECDALIRQLQGSQPQPEGDRQRKKIISMCHEMGWELPGGRIDMNRVNGFCKEKGYLKKPLNDYSLNELPKLVTQFQEVYKKYLNEVGNVTPPSV